MEEKLNEIWNVLSNVNTRLNKLEKMVGNDYGKSEKDFHEYLIPCLNYGIFKVVIWGNQYTSIDRERILGNAHEYVLIKLGSLSDGGESFVMGNIRYELSIFNRANTEYCLQGTICFRDLKDNNKRWFGFWYSDNHINDVVLTTELQKRLAEPYCNSFYTIECDGGRKVMVDCLSA